MTPSPDALRQALSYLTPHALTKAPVVLQADELRQAVETISAALATVAEEPGDAVEGEGWSKAQIEAASAAFYDSMIGPKTKFWPHHDGWAGKTENFKERIRGRMKLALCATAPKANGVGTGEEGGRQGRFPNPTDAELSAFYRAAWPAAWDFSGGVPDWKLVDLRRGFEAMAGVTPSQAKPAALAAKPEGEKASVEEVLAELIRTRLLGVRPDEQDLVLEDDDWRLILAALTTTTGSGGRADAPCPNPEQYDKGECCGGQCAAAAALVDEEAGS